jgi:hypothetical protein
LISYGILNDFIQLQIDTRAAGNVITCLLTPWSRVLLEKPTVVFENLTGFQLVKKIPAFYGTPKFNYLQVPATRPYPEPARSSPYPHIPLSEDPS